VDRGRGIRGRGRGSGLGTGDQGWGAVDGLAGA